MTWNDSLTKTTPQEACGAYIKNAPRGFLPQGAWLYMDLFAVFSLAAVPVGAVPLGAEVSVGVPAAGFFSTNNRIDSSFKAFMRDVTWLRPVCRPLQPTWRYRRY